jgi:hypothetical protein
MIQMAESVLKNKLSKAGAESFLKAARENVSFLGKLWSSKGRVIHTEDLIQQIPKTRDAVFHRLGLNPEITTQICCKKCFALYPLSNSDTDPPAKCTQSFLSQYQGYCKWAKSQAIEPTCDEDLFELDKQCKSKPIRTYSYVTMKSWLKAQLSRPSFESLLDSSLSAASWDRLQDMEDVWHGRVWQEFPNLDDGSGIYTEKSGNLVFSLYLDWFNAEGTSNLGKHNSIGAVILICLNLPPV